MTEINTAESGIFAPEHPLPFIIYAAVLGVVLAFCFDFFSLGDRLFGRNKVILFFTDLLSVISAYFLLFAGALHYNDGIIRWYHAASVISGYRLYKRVLSHSVKILLDKAYSVLEKIIKTAFAVLIFPIKLLSGFSVKLYRSFVRVSGVVATEALYKKEKNKFAVSARHGFGMNYHLADNKHKNKKGRSETKGWKTKRSERLPQ